MIELPEMPLFQIKDGEYADIEAAAKIIQRDMLGWFVGWLEESIERFDADGNLVISLSSYKELKKLREGEEGK